MSRSAPAPPKYYTRLAPFREVFAAANPLLTYHQFGPRPRGTRLKGMFLPDRLFAQQLAEFAAAKVRFLELGESLRLPGGTGVVLTIDDGFCSVRTWAQPRLAEVGARALLYVVAGRLGGTNTWDVAQGEVPGRLMDTAELTDWLAAGHQLGSHTLTHPWLTRVSRAQAREEIHASRRRLEDFFGVVVRDFCYPYGDWNNAVRDLVVEAGYETAVTTQAGVNGPSADPFALRRFTARHATRNWKSLREALRRWWNSREAAP